MTTFQQARVETRPRASAPVLPTRYMTVKAKGEAVVYAADGVPIPNDRFVSVPVSAGTVQAVKYGDLEEAEAVPAEQHQKRHHRRHDAE